MLKATGASLLGTTITATAAAASPVNAGVDLLEARLSLEFEDDENLAWKHVDRPPKYGIDAERGTLEILTVDDGEVEALTAADEVVNFRGVEADPDAIGGETLTSLFGGEELGLQDTYVRSPDGYEMPRLDVNVDATRPSELLDGDAMQEVTVDADRGVVEFSLPGQEVTVQERIVRDEFEDIAPDTDLEPSRVVERRTTTTTAIPSLAVALHRDLDVVRVD